LHYAVSKGAKITNNSWTGQGDQGSLEQGISEARAAGTIVVAAAGNEGSNNDVTPVYPAGYTLDNVVSVAATDRNDNLASFSNYGPHTVTLGAPGVEILSTIPGNKYGFNSGTSMATPHVTGVLALVWSEHPDWTYRQVINQVTNTVDRLPSLIGKTETGGRVDA